MREQSSYSLSVRILYLSFLYSILGDLWCDITKTQDLQEVRLVGKNHSPIWHKQQGQIFQISKSIDLLLRPSGRVELGCFIPLRGFLYNHRKTVGFRRRISEPSKQSTNQQYFLDICIHYQYIAYIFLIPPKSSLKFSSLAWIVGIVHILTIVPVAPLYDPADHIGLKEGIIPNIFLTYCWWQERMHDSDISRIWRFVKTYLQI